MKKKILIILCIIATFFITTRVKAVTPVSSPNFQGIDVSSWQGFINFEEVKNSGIEVVYIKASQGTGYKDPYFETNYENAKANGLKVGFYHYLTATSVSDAEAEAQFFASVISGKIPDCLLVMDFESFNGLSRDGINTVSEAFLNKLNELTGKEVAIYSDLSNAQDTFNEELASKYPLWLAYYEDYNQISNVETSWNNWIGLQNSDDGEIPGIRGFVDTDIFTEDIFLDEVTESPSVDKLEVENSGEIYIVKSGDTLSQIARDFGTTVQEIVNLNNIQNPNLIFPGERLIISNSTSNGFDNSNNSETTDYIVKRGNTLSQIALEFGTSVQEIVDLNNIQNPNLIFPGENLKIISNTNFNLLGETNQINYTVRRGNTLSEIALRFNTTVGEIVRLNNIQNPNLIFVGQRLRIPI